MTPNRNHRLVTKIFIIGMVVAFLGYLFHPGVGQFTVLFNGEPVADPLVRFAAIPSFLLLMLITGLLMLLAFFGMGVMVFFGALFLALLLGIILVPYFWPLLVIIFLTITLASVNHDAK